MTQSRLVMIVDDDVALRTAFARVLERVGYSTLAITGSNELPELINTHQPSLILLDNHMPEASGLDLIKAIRQQWSLTQLPIVLISGSSMQGEVDEAMKAGANDFRRKPVDIHDLIAIVETILEQPTTIHSETQGSRS